MTGCTAISGKPFRKKFITQEGVVGSGSQTSYVLALKAQMIPDTLKETVINNLVNAIKERDWHVSTGFFRNSVSAFLFYQRMAGLILRINCCLTKTFPSWGYMIKKWSHNLVGTLGQ